MPDEKDFNFEDTKSTILDYFILFKQVRAALIWIILGSVLSFLLFKETFFHLVEHFRDNGLVYTIPDGPLAFVIHLDGAFIYSMIGFVLSPCVAVVIAWLFYTTIIKGRKLQKHLINFQNNLIKRSYLTNFELVEPEIIIQGGDPKLEKFVNHLSLVFTDINKKNKKRLKKGKTVEQFFPYKRKRLNLGFTKNYFFVANTGFTLYVTQYFEKTITVEDIQKTIKFLRKEKILDTIIGAKIFETLPSIRFIIFGEKVDSSFDDENIIQTMNELKRKFKIDIILETEYGYSTVWID
jgi:hypothetical protein